MISIRKFAIVLVLSLFIAIPFLVTPSYALSSEPSMNITEWEMKWEEPDSTGPVQKVSSVQELENWFLVKYNDPIPEKPNKVQTAWLKFQLPKLEWARPTLLISKLNAKSVTIYIDNQIVYETNRQYANDYNKVLLPLTVNESQKSIYIKLTTVEKKIGIDGQPTIGEYQSLVKGYMTRDILDVILGAALTFISLAMLISIVFMNKLYLKSWSSLCVIILSVGLMILTNSPFFHTTYSEFGLVSYYLFDFASNLLMPAIFFFFESIFGKGPYGLISHLKKILVIIVIISNVLLLASFASDAIREWYIVFGILGYGVSVIIGNILLICCSIMYCRQRNKEAIILTTGFGLFAATGAAELVWFFIQNRGYDMFYWKWGVLCFIVSLIIILSRRILRNYEQVVEYSKRIEIFNNELQRSEKMEIISQLAASVAHEVRNPLQVTRGFLQLLGAKTVNEKDKSYMVLAIDELDRASEIITDFLTFAKPQLEQTIILNIENELHQIEGILVPMATMQGGVIKLDLTPNLYVQGNSSKFKQALINIIKNSIEALGKEGTIQILAYEVMESKEVFIRIIDNGEGMNEADLKRLGEPYYSKKTKGTGLGLMVTFRIIEVMQGKITFTSKKGFGTEVVMQFPIAKK